MKKVFIFGSTGSIGKNALEVLRFDKQRMFKVEGLCSYQDIDTLYLQIKEFSPSYVCVVNEKKAEILSRRLHKKVKLLTGESGLLEFASLSGDISIMAISGIACLKPLLINIQHTKRIALANKESLVIAGSFIFEAAKKYKTEIIPVDSEINAFFQLFSSNAKQFQRVYITASGGALLDYPRNALARVGIKNVLNHPTWKMGKRITVDSATFVNKGFEVIETHRFFNVPYENIDVIIHRNSAVHALVEFSDTTFFACLYPPSMQIPISFALYYPQRAQYTSVDNKKFQKKISYVFEPFNRNQFPLFKLIVDAAKKGDNALAILNACDEVAIDFFLTKRITFLGIHKVMKYFFTHYPRQTLQRVDDVLFWDHWARRKTEEYLNKL